MTFALDDEHNLALRTNDEKAYRASTLLYKSLTGLVPGGGALLGQVYDALVANPSTQRRDRMLMEVWQGLCELQERQLLSPSDLEGDDSIRAIILQAVQAAVRSTGATKTEALRNIVLNAARHKPENRYRAMIVLSVVDRMTEAHISILKEFGELPEPRQMPTESAAMIGVPFLEDAQALAKPFRTVTGQYVDREAIYVNSIILKDLVSIGALEELLVSTAKTVWDYSTDPDKNGTDYFRLTEIGSLVLGEISQPLGAS